MKFRKLEQIVLASTAVGSVILTRFWIVTFAWILTALAGQLATPPAFAQTRPAVELERAIAQEQVDGDLNAAMAAYQRTAGNKSAPRDVRARALLQLAGCYEKLGRQSSDVYQQIVGEYGGQPPAAQARARLAALKKASANESNIIARKLDSLGRDFRSGDTDGKHVVYRNAATGELIYDDLAGKLKRVIYRAEPGDLKDYFPSRDLSMVALLFANKPDRPAYLAVINNDGTGYRELVRDDEQGKSQGLGIEPVRRVTWSWDKRDLLVTVSGENSDLSAINRGGRLLVVSVANGKRRKVIDVAPGLPRGAMFSPDGRFVAYEVLNMVNTVPMQTFIVPAAGGKPNLIHEERITGPFMSPAFHDWTADGRYLAISNAVGSAPTLQLFPVEDGQAAGAPISVRPGVFINGSTTQAGALISWVVPTQRFPGIIAHLASLDPDGRPGPWQPLDLRGRGLAHDYVAWSPDGNQIVYTAKNDDPWQAGSQIVRVRNLVTGQDRELRRTVTPAGCKWLQPSKLLCAELPSGDMLAGNPNVYTVSLESGAIEPLDPLPFSITPALFEASSDSRALYVGRPDPATGMIDLVRWDIATRQETVVERALAPRGYFRLSPDESWLIRLEGFTLAARPTSGGDWKPLVTVNKDVTRSNVFNEFAVTPDSKSVVYHDLDSAGKDGLFRVPISGGASERLGDYPGSGVINGTIQISPDGRKIAVATLSVAQNREFEVWLLQNFAPAVPKR